jgi:Family of unknown function (DUF6348)
VQNRIVAHEGDEAIALQRIAEGLERLTGRAHRVGGNQVVGPGTTSLMIGSHPDVPESAQSAHLDVGFVLNRDRDDTTIWDCASGFGTTRSEAMNAAVDAWLQTTAPVVLELLTSHGTFADHYSSAECGLAGRHVIHGAILGWGWGDGPDQLQQWWLAHPLLPVLAPAIAPNEWPVLGALRIFFGSQRGQSTAEVKLNGRPLTAADDLLLQQDWPRFEQPAYVRTFVLSIPETP